MSLIRVYASLVALSVVAGCVTQKYRSTLETDRKTVKNELDEEMSLKADRDELDSMRKQIPEEKRISNDELALNLQVMNQGTERPEVVHSKFTTLVEKRRSSFRSKVQRLREDYRRLETKRRDNFLNSQKTKRAKFNVQKNSADETKEFFADQDKERQNFFADERDRRSNFESEISAQSKDFDSYMREKLNEFNEQYRLYSKMYSEKRKERKAVTGDIPADYKRIEDVPAKTMGTED